MLDMRPDCERCGTDLPADEPGAFICSFECTYCAPCAEALDDRCPNCGGELMDRPAKPAYNKVKVRALKLLKDMAK